MREQIKITRDQLVEMLANLTGSTIIGITYKKEQKTLVKHRDDKTLTPYKGLKKLSKHVMIIGINYVNCLTNAIERLNMPPLDPSVGSRGSWHEPTNIKGLSRHKGDHNRLYLFGLLRSSKSTYVDASGKTYDRIDKGYLPAKQPIPAHGVLCPTLSLECVESVRMFGKEYLITE